MDDMLSLAETIADKLKESDMYKQYISAKHTVNSNPGLKSSIEKFKKANFDYHHKIMNNESPSFDEEKEISSIYWSLMRNDDTKNYIESEKKLVELLDKIYNVIGGACEIDMFIPIE